MKFRDLATTAVAISMLAAGPALAQTQAGSGQGSMATQGSTMSEANQPPMSQSMVKHLQQTLQQRGLYQGQVDGIYGPATKTAVQKFQQENNLQATGKLNVRTLSELGVIGHQQTAERNTTGESGMQHGMTQGTASNEATTGRTGTMNSAENGTTAGSPAMTSGQQEATAGQTGAASGMQNGAENGSQKSAENGTAAGSHGAANGQPGSMKTAENAHGVQSATPGASSQHSAAATGAANGSTGTTETTGSGH